MSDYMWSNMSAPRTRTGDIIGRGSIFESDTIYGILITRQKRMNLLQLVNLADSLVLANFRARQASEGDWRGPMDLHEKLAQLQSSNGSHDVGNSAPITPLIYSTEEATSAEPYCVGDSLESVTPPPRLPPRQPYAIVHGACV